MAGRDRTPTKTPAKGAAKDRDDRLKAALKANIARRKAQARARRDEGGGGPGTDTDARDPGAGPDAADRQG